MQDKKIRTAVIGVGKMGGIHAKVYDQLPQSELIAVVDADIEKAKSIAEKYNCSAFSDSSDVIGKVDAVTISAPTIGEAEAVK